MKKQLFKNRIIKLSLANLGLLSTWLSFAFYSQLANAFGEGGRGTQQSRLDNLGKVASTITGSFGALAKLITAGAYMAGIGFCMASMLKFKTHKDNPTQIPIGTPVALLFIGAALIFLPNIFGIAGNTIFGGTSGAGGTGGVTGLSGNGG